MVNGVQPSYFFHSIAVTGVLNGHRFKILSTMKMLGNREEAIMAVKILTTLR